MDPETIKTLATVVISAGGAAFIKEVFAGLLKLRSGKSAREGKRRSDIIAQRDEAAQAKKDLEAKADAEEKRADEEAHKRRALEEYAALLRRQAIDRGTPIAALPEWPKY